MELLLPSIERFLPKFNVKAHTFEDVERITKRHRINLKICKYNPNILGYFCIRKTPKRTKRYIVINSSLGPLDRTLTGFHELAHYFLHVPVSADQYFFCRRNAERTSDKHDAEANAIALIAVIPLWMMIDAHATNYTEIEPAMVPLLKRRYQIWKTYGI